MLIAVCGIDGAGKTTQIKNIEKYFLSIGNKVHLTKQPTNWYRKDERVKRFLNEEINDKDIIKELALFSAADKLRHIHEEIIPKLNEDYVVITDRYVFSAYAYFYIRCIKDIKWLKEINRYILEPDITFYIKTNPKVAYKRIIKRDGDNAKREEKDIEFLEKVSDVFEKQIWGETNNYYVINGNEKVDNVKKELIDVIEKKIEI